MPKLLTQIDSVVVYPDRARVLRRGTLHLEAGSHRLETHEDLPLSLDVASLRAAARGSGRGRLTGVEVGQRFYAEPPAQKVQTLETQIDALTDELTTLESKQQILTMEQIKLHELEGQSKAFAKGLAAGRVTPDAHMNLLDKIRRRSEVISAALIELSSLVRKKNRHMEKLQQELGQLKPDSKKRYYATIDVEVAEVGDFEVDLTYVVSRAGWEPLYDIRLVEGDTPPVLEMGYLGQVKQQTGEDWSDVTLTLSTARPAVAAILPELQPWYVGPLPPAPAPVMAGAVSPADMSLRRSMTADLGEAAPMALHNMEEAQAAVDMQGTAVTYQIPGRSSVSGDGAPRKVTIGRYDLSPELDYTAAPKLVALAYRRAKATNDSDYTLLPGRASLFAGEEFIGGSRLELIAPQGEFEMFLGADDRLQVERELVRRQVDKRFASSKRRIHYGYEIKVHNLLTTPASITLFDQLPISTHEAISVHLESAQPDPDAKTDLNILRWDVVLQPNEKRTLRFEFMVEHPQDMAITGLP